MEHIKGNRRAVFGLILIVVGFLLIVSHLGVLPAGWKHVIISWQGLLILIGAVLLLSRQSNPAGWILILIGGFFLIPRIMPDEFEWQRLFWPVVLLGLGSLIIFREVTRHRYRQEADADFLDIVNIFGGGDRRINSQDFRGGRITAVFGGSKLDMKSARLAEGSNDLDVFLMFGGIKLIAPSGWDIRMEVTSIFGGFSDKRQSGSPEVKEPGRELVIKGLAVFGGGDIVSF